MQSINEEMQHAPIGLGFSSFGRGCDFFFWVWVKGWLLFLFFGSTKKFQVFISFVVCKKNYTSFIRNLTNILDQSTYCCLPLPCYHHYHYDLTWEHLFFFCVRTRQTIIHIGWWFIMLYISCTMFAILSWLHFSDLVTLIMVVLHDINVNFLNSTIIYPYNCNDSTHKSNHIQ